MKIESSIYVFIDASNVWELQKSKKKAFDYVKLTKYLKEFYEAKELKVFYYTAYPAEGTRDYSLDGKHKFYTFLKKSLRYVVRKKPLKQIIIHEEVGDRVMEKGNMDVEITIDVMQYLNQYNTAIFFTGDSDFLALINYIRKSGKKAFVYSSKRNVSNELRTGADGYVDILSLHADIWGSSIGYKHKTALN